MKVRAGPILSATAKNEKTPQPIGCGEIETFWKQQEKVENSAEKLQNGAAGAGKRTPSRPTKKPSRLKMVGHLYKTHLENRSSTSLILCDTTKKRACDILYVTGFWCAWRDSNPRHLASEASALSSWATDADVWKIVFQRFSTYEIIGKIGQKSSSGQFVVWLPLTTAVLRA